MRTRIILIRHGETEWNRELVFRGRKDVLLNERGRLQAGAIADALGKIGIKTIYSSNLSRAFDTALPLAQELGSDIKIRSELKDANFGEWEGKMVSEVEKKYPELFKIWRTKPWKITFPSGESYREIAERAYKALVEITQKHAGEIVPAFTHRFILKVMICEALGFHRGFWQIFLSTGSISELWYEDDKFILAKLNDTAHLASLAQGGQVDF